MKCQNPTKYDLLVSEKRNERKTIELPCRSCLPCILNRHDEHVTRQRLAYAKHGVGIFVTFTFTQATLPLDNSISKKTLRAVYKILHKELKKLNTKIQHYSSGEYGESDFRPHYHANIFGLNPYTHIFTGDTKLQDKKITKMLTGFWKPQHIKRYITGLSHIERELYRAWAYQGLIEVREYNDSRASYVAKHNLKHTDLTQHKYLNDKQLKPFISRSRGLGLEQATAIAHSFVQNNYYPTILPNLKQNENSIPIDWNCVRLQGKKHKIDPYFQKKIIKEMGKILNVEPDERATDLKLKHGKRFIKQKFDNTLKQKGFQHAKLEKQHDEINREKQQDKKLTQHHKYTKDRRAKKNKLYLSKMESQT